MAEAPVQDGVVRDVDIRQDLERVTSARTRVPSERELQLGAIEAYEFQPVIEEPLGTTVPLRARLLPYVRMLDVRAIAAGGPLLPLILLGYFNLVAGLDQQAFGLLLPDIRNDFGVGVFLLLGVQSALGILSVAAGPVTGFISDRVRRVTMLGAGAVVSHASFVLAGLSPGVGTLAGTRVIGQVGELVRQPVGFPLLADYYPPPSRARVYVFVQMCLTLGLIAGPLVAGFVAANYGWRPTLIAFGLIAVIISFSFFLLKEPVRGRLDRLAAGADEEAASQEQRPVGWSEGWRAAWSVRTLRYIAFAFPFLIAGAQVVILFPSLWYGDHFHLSPLPRGLIISAATVPSLVGLAISGVVADRVIAYKPGRLMGILAGTAVMVALGLVLFALSPLLPLTIVCNMVIAFGAALILPALITPLSLVVPARIRGLGLQTFGPFAIPGVFFVVFLAVEAGSIGVQAAMLWAVPIILVGAVIIAAGSGGFEQDIRAALAASRADEVARASKQAGRSKLLVCRDIDVVYDGAQVLFGVDFDVSEGELVALLGTNGAGKSTLLRAIGGIQQASNGAIFLDGDDITHLPPHLIAARGVVTMPGGQAVFPTLTVEQNLQTAGWMYRSDPAYLKQKLDEVLARFPQLTTRWTTQAGNLSGGEQQMVALGQALLMKPRLLMVDELSLGLAPQVVQLLLDALREIRRQGTTVIIVEQSINVALQIAERAVYMEKGEIRFDGTVEELRRRPDVVHSVFLAGAATADLSTSTQRRLNELGDERETVLTCTGLELSYGGVRVLNGVSLSADRAEVIGLVGPNGAGKTTLFDAISGAAQLSAGSIQFMGRDVTRLGVHQRAQLGLARSYQNVKLFPALTVRESIAVALERHLRSRSMVHAALWTPISNQSERRARRRVDNLIQSLGLGAYAGKFVNELSTGTRRIVDIACVLATQPKLLLLDEPSSGLAQAETELLAPVIGRIVKETNCGVLIIEHDLGLVASVSHRMIALRLGTVMAEGTPAQVLGNADVVDALLGGASEAVVSRSLKLDRQPEHETQEPRRRNG
ncbi:MAG TPA: MFS transporter [Candidatus Dormibacteraeota bacterium]|jgi:branched-chain amino acid transport system ATP-binding protein|nr:MFS transporter [Candidatus Dormibacteraeota bacterium]